MTDSPGLTFRWAASLGEIDPSAWNELARPLPAPFLEHEWLSLLETSGSVTPATGWEPHHLLAWRGRRLVAACPLYIKSSSEGEFVFDYLWSEVAGRIGLPYFPKLVGMSPLTPVGAYRFLVAPGEDAGALTGALGREILRFAAERGLAGVHLQYADAAWAAEFETAGYARWDHPCYLWTNPGHTSFEDFLASFSKNTRRNIRREEESVGRRGYRVRFVAGEEIDPAWHDLMYRYYLGTNEKFGPWAALYLTGDFFRGVFHEFRHRLGVSAAFRDGESSPAALAMFLFKGDRLWGRYWGARTFVPHLHFNVCYYAPFRWALTHGIRHFDPGIGTEHKARRGFTACLVPSLHRFADEKLDAIFRANIGRLNAQAQRTIDDLNAGIFHET